MADSKISGLTALTSVATSDLVEVVDVSDTSMAASGTNKQATVANLATAVSTALSLDAVASSGSASDLTTGTLPSARLGTGTVASTTYVPAGVDQFASSTRLNSSDTLSAGIYLDVSTYDATLSLAKGIPALSYVRVRGGTLSTLSILVTTATGATTGDTCIVMFYEALPDGLPGALQHSFTFDVSAGTGTKTLSSLTNTIVPGFYWAGALFPQSNAGSALSLKGATPSIAGAVSRTGLLARSSLNAGTSKSTPAADLTSQVWSAGGAAEYVGTPAVAVPSCWWKVN